MKQRKEKLQPLLQYKIEINSHIEPRAYPDFNYYGNVIANQ